MHGRGRGRRLARGIAPALFLLLQATSPIAGAEEATGGAAVLAPPAAEAGASAEVAAPTAAAPGEAHRTWAYDLATQLMSPFCPGRTVASCPSPQAAELIQWIATQEAAGVTRDEVVDMLIQRYGEEILGAPPARGITLWAYVFPVLGFFAFGAIAVVVLRRIVAPTAAGGALPVSPAAQAKADAAARPAVAAPGADPAADELARIVDAELAERA